MSMSEPEIQRLLEQPLVAVLGTADADGRPALAPIWYRWRGQDLVFCTQTYTRKWRNITRDPRISLSIDTKEAPYSAVIVEGTAEAVPDADYDATLTELAMHYLGEAGGREFMAGRSPTPETSMVVRVRPERMISWAY